MPQFSFQNAAVNLSVSFADSSLKKEPLPHSSTETKNCIISMVYSHISLGYHLVSEAYIFLYSKLEGTRRRASQGLSVSAIRRGKRHSVAF